MHGLVFFLRLSIDRTGVQLDITSKTDPDACLFWSAYCHMSACDQAKGKVKRLLPLFDLTAGNTCAV